MLKYIIAAVVSILMMPHCAMAQKAEISKARANIKNGAKLEEAENSMRQLLKDSVNRHNDKIWLTLFDAVKKQFDQLNEKLYLKQQSDTAKFFKHTLHMYDVLESLDSIDNIPTKNGKIEHAFRKRHSTFLDPYRHNLFNGGLYFIKKKDFGEAFRFFDSYVGCASQPLFSDFHYDKNDEKLLEAAYWATFCGYKMDDYEKIDRYTDLAERDISREVYTLQYKSESFRLKGDTANYRKTLELGFRKYPRHMYYFSHLAFYYGSSGRHKDVLEIGDRILAMEKDNATVLIAMSSAYYNLKRYDECVSACDKVIEFGIYAPIVYANAGLSYYVQSLPLARKTRKTEEEKEKQQTFYKRARTYLENYRKMRPQDTSVWLQPLYDIYLNLNMGDQFEEIEQLFNKQ